MKSVCNRVAGLLALAWIAAIGLASPPAQAASADTGVVNINTASAGQLQLLKGIGAKKAQAIIDFRAKAPFATVDDLTKVKGIGKKLVEGLRAQIAVQGETTLKAKPKVRKRRSAKSGG
jgi:competence protein ComEA